ncbi:MAG: amidohydrolase family protein [Betaproteobacteria bacterium]|nr:amidohydrolase family protein [Betaproteobacteria bacterium]MDH3435741.1 amidohydrolase family protein [Betaproteobacteria bacterium]
MATPKQACDAHFHIFGPVSRFPYSPARAYTPPEAPLEALLAMHARLGFARGVVVQGNAHGTDNSALLDALEREPKRLRAVAIVKEDTERRELERMALAGVRALRFHHQPRQGGTYSSLGFAAFEKLAPHMAELGLHVQFFMDARGLPDLMPLLKGWNLPVVLDHFGSTKAAEGTAAPGFQTLRRFLSEGRIWVKISGAYRASEQYPDYADARALHEALIAANPDQLLWGTDWPHPRLEKNMPDTGHLLDLFNAWTPDSGVRHKILAENPARLYGF